jgi:hypothetical protein
VRRGTLRSAADLFGGFADAIAEIGDNAGLTDSSGARRC